MPGFADVTNEYKNRFDNGGIAAVVQQIKLDFEKCDVITLHIAVTGAPGSGKSSFINALRGIDVDDKFAAPTGVRERTNEPTLYTYPNNATVNIWYLPVIGTPNFQASEYLERVKFDRYDFFVILSASRFTENDICLATEIQQRKKKFYLVRSKIDQDLDSAKYRESSQFNEKKTLEKQRNDSVESLKKEGIKSPQVFLISSRNLDKFDFGKLQEVVKEDLPALKKQFFLLSLPNITSSIIDMKKEIMMDQFKKIALLSAAAAAVPIPGLSIVCDVPLLVKNLTNYRTDFGLDDGSLGRLAKKVRKSPEVLSSEVKSTFGMSVTEAVVVVALKETQAAGSMAESFLMVLPVIGSLAAARQAYNSTYALMGKAVQEMAEDSKRVLAKAMSEVE